MVVMRKTSIVKQFMISITLVVLLTVICYFLGDILDYRIVALILLLAVSILAVSFDILPVLSAAVLSTLSLNFFFIAPILNYKIDNSESALLFFVYLFIALVSAVLTNRLRRQERKIRDREEKENTIKLYNTLLNSLSHELKTPIATIIGTIDTLKEADRQMLPAQRLELLSDMEIASMRLNNQVENLLNMSRLETGMLRLKTDWSDVNEFIFSVIRKFLFISDHTIIFEPDERLPLFKLDIGLMEPVLYGIIQNGLLYTPENTTICIKTTYDVGHLQITIVDNGPGIPEEKIAHVFDKFYRLPQSRTGGSGLGLSIAKGFVEAHHGSIVLTNLESGGARFLITIPAEVSYIKNLKNE